MRSLVKNPKNAKALVVLGHGAGAGMRHPFMESTAELLYRQQIATFRYEFTYMEQGRKRPDPPRALLARIREALSAGPRKVPGLPVIAGGKSMGGRMTSVALAESPADGVAGLLFLGFPLHAPGKGDEAGVKRAEHLFEIGLPMLLVQGTRDRLAELDKIRGLCRSIGKRATLHVVEGADHSFNVLKRSGRDQSEVMEEIADAVSSWINQIV